MGKSYNIPFGLSNKIARNPLEKVIVIYGV